MSDFVRDAVRDKLKEIKVINIRGDVDYDTAKVKFWVITKNMNELVKMKWLKIWN